MAKLSLKADPTFEAGVKIPRLGQDPVEVKFTFKHRTQAELDALLKTDLQLQQQAIANPDAPQRTDEELVMELACAWELDDAFTLENVRALCQHYHGAAPAISKAYLDAFAKARLGN